MKRNLAQKLRACLENWGKLSSVTSMRKVPNGVSTSNSHSQPNLVLLLLYRKRYLKQSYVWIGKELVHNQQNRIVKEEALMSTDLYRLKIMRQPWHRQFAGKAHRRSTPPRENSLVEQFCDVTLSPLWPLKSLNQPLPDNLLFSVAFEMHNLTSCRIAFKSQLLGRKISWERRKYLPNLAQSLLLSRDYASAIDLTIP